MTANIGPGRIAGHHDTALAGPPVDRPGVGPRDFHVDLEFHEVDDAALPAANAAA
jgi:hypothetical protein